MQNTYGFGHKTQTFPFHLKFIVCERELYILFLSVQVWVNLNFYHLVFFQISNSNSIFSLSWLSNFENKIVQWQLSMEMLRLHKAIEYDNRVKINLIRQLHQQKDAVCNGLISFFIEWVLARLYVCKWALFKQAQRTVHVLRPVLVVKFWNY